MKRLGGGVRKQYNPNGLLEHVDEDQNEHSPDVKREIKEPPKAFGLGPKRQLSSNSD